MFSLFCAVFKFMGYKVAPDRNGLDRIGAMSYMYIVKSASVSPSSADLFGLNLNVNSCVCFG